MKSKQQNRSFGLLFFIVFFILALWPLTKSNQLNYYLLSISLIFLILGLLNSKILSPLNKSWIKLGEILGRIIAPVVMAFVYFLKMNIKTAGGINLLLSILVGISAYLGHSFSGDLDYYLIVSIVLPTILGMYFGSRFVKIVDDKQLRKILGVTLLILSLILFVREL